MAKDKLLVILGPTAVGKTALSIELAKQLDTEIISGDSMLVYRGFDIGAAKPSLAERQGIVHHLVDIMPPDEKFNVTDFIEGAQPIIHELNERGKIPILAGGTGLYVKALLEGYQFNETAGHEAYRQELQQLGEQNGHEFVHAMLAKVNPEAAARLHPNDFRRVVRALEVAHFGNERISQSKAADNGELCYDVLVIGLERERQELYNRINRRVELMFEAGLVEEVAGLLAAGINREEQAMKGIGYKETAAYLAGEMSKSEALALIQKSTRHFAKRQLTWYRKMPYIHWYEVDELSEAELLADVLQEVAGFFPAR
ncbi:MAG: tRNA (adenosine(37)-N6)-dimethylallyltransferase MiaA [Selenomonas sp.]|uniref:tRNA (adenosine(37)-N6)-dimethylallyltransferase MiaA n=1 Tax=Selenomonas sp. TaxID=2053611 RepID=UPI0025CE3FB2|nr:tRNA (adenosine(37)-N6)-dimethylallyltransferase MiaA [Selenomonas sp.]MCR5438961.1 tRNA (adenosine(37)-N6)-dimethylallyltransferase MiaA [Selenomonas sp.]